MLVIYLVLYLVVSLLCVYFEQVMKVIVLICMLVLGFATTFFFINEVPLPLTARSFATSRRKVNFSYDASSGTSGYVTWSASSWPSSSSWGTV
jgi:hypothetical protein